MVLCVLKRNLTFSYVYFGGGEQAAERLGEHEEWLLVRKGQRK